MSLPEKVTVTLTLVDGTHRTFTFEPPPGEEVRIAQRVEEFMSSPTIAFQLPDRLLMIPKSQIMSIEFSPRVDKQIDGVFGHAVEVW